MESAFVGMIVNAILNWLKNFFSSHLAAYEKDQANHQAAVDQAAQDNEASTHINEKSSSDEIDSAGDDSLKHL